MSAKRNICLLWNKNVRNKRVIYLVNHKFMILKESFGLIVFLSSIILTKKLRNLAKVAFFCSPPPFYPSTPSAGLLCPLLYAEYPDTPPRCAGPLAEYFMMNPAKAPSGGQWVMQDESIKRASGAVWLARLSPIGQIRQGPFALFYTAVPLHSILNKIMQRQWGVVLFSYCASRK